MDTNMNKNTSTKFLPIGSVVLLDGGEKRLMITGYGQLDETKGVFDYSGCLFPEGILNSEQVLLFNHDQISNLYFEGYVDQEQLEFIEQATPIIEQAKGNINLDANA